MIRYSLIFFWIYLPAFFTFDKTEYVSLLSLQANIISSESWKLEAVVVEYEFHLQCVWNECSDLVADFFPFLLKW